MTPTDSPQELRLKSGHTILQYVRSFSATEKGIFGILALIVVGTALVMASRVNSYFMVDIPAFDGHISEGLVGLPHTVNPVLAATDVDRDISSLVYSGLMRYDGGNLVPDLAASYDVSNDGLTYTFTLKNGLTFQDGSPITTADVAYTIDRIQDATLKSPRLGDWRNIGVKVVSPTVIQFTLKQAYSPFITNTTVGILPKHIWGPLSDDQFGLSQYNIEPVGSGPYKESSIGTSGGIPDSYTLSAWSGYYGMRPHIATITFHFFADEEKALSALDQGSIDSLAAISPADASRLASDTAQPYTVISAPLPRIFGVFFNQNQAPVLADKSVRSALSMVVDRDAIVKNALNGYGEPINGPLPIGLGGASASSVTPVTNVIPSSLGAGTTKTASGATSSSTASSAALTAAQNLLNKNGWTRDPQTGIYELTKKGSKNVQTLSFDIYTADTPDLKATADMLKDEWTALGADVSVKVFEPADLYPTIIRGRKFDVLLFGESIGKDRDLYAFWHSSERNAPGLNVSQYANSKVDKLLEDIRATSDDTVRATKYAQFAQALNADVPAIFLYVPDFIYAVPKTLHGVDLGTMTVPSDRFSSVSDWYDTTEQVWKIFATHNQ